MIEDLAGRYEFAVGLAKEAGAIARRYFRRSAALGIRETARRIFPGALAISRCLSHIKQRGGPKSVWSATR
jgi:hypothetical protein